MEERTKQEFRALREQVGMTQQVIADLLGVRERSVRRWESLDAPQFPPAPAWELVDRAIDRQQEGIRIALGTVQQLQDDFGEPRAVVLPYWMNQDDYETWSTDAISGTATTYQEANANIRALAAVLKSRSIFVGFISGEEWREVYGE